MKRVRRHWPLALLVVLLWVARYWHSTQFGLYEDDLTHLPVAASMSVERAVSFAFDPGRILRLEGQGHPLHYTFIYLLTNLGWRLGGMTGPYGFGFAIEALNIVLFYRLITRVHGRRLALFSGLAFVLYSADTTQAYLTYSLGLQPSITVLLLACLAYIDGKTWLAYLISPLMLLTYETVFPVFFAAPLLLPRSRRSRARDALGHALALGGILAGFALWRLTVGDDRLGGLTAAELLRVPLLHMLQGPPVSLGTYLYRGIQAIQGLDTEVALASIVGTAGLAWLFLKTDLGTPRNLASTLTSGRGRLKEAGVGWSALRGAVEDLPTELRSLLRLGLAGALSLVLAYPLTFTVRAYAISGRDTRVHAAGLFGAALLIGCMALLALWTAEALDRRRWVAFGLAAWFGLLTGYGFVLQRDYRLAWSYQQEFWSELVRLVPDIEEGDSVLVEPAGLKDTRQIGANYWALPVVLEQLYQFPSSWRRTVWVYRMDSDWREGVLTADGRLSLDAVTTFAPPSTYAAVDPSATILIDTEGGHLVRLSEVELDGTTIALKPLPPHEGEPPFPRGFLYPYLIGAGPTE